MSVNIPPELKALLDAHDVTDAGVLSRGGDANDVSEADLKEEYKNQQVMQQLANLASDPSLTPEARAAANEILKRRFGVTAHRNSEKFASNKKTTIHRGNA
jgi:hypothetical protein